jgi:ketosteroid isomerase-like protein
MPITPLSAVMLVATLSADSPAATLDAVIEAMEICDAEAFISLHDMTGSSFDLDDGGTPESHTDYDMENFATRCDMSEIEIELGEMIWMGDSQTQVGAGPLSFSMTGPDGPLYELEGRLTAVLVQREGAWRLLHSHISPVQSD